MTPQEKSSLDIEVFNPLQNLIADYKNDCERVTQLSGMVENDISTMDYFFNAARVKDRQVSVNVSTVFQLEPAIKAIDAKYWQTAMSLTDVLECMPADKRNDWNEQIRTHKTPTFELESVKATLTDMLSSRERFHAERVDGIFQALSRSHVTNIPQGFGKRFILEYMYSGAGTWIYVRHERANYIHDLRCAVAKIMGREGARNADTQKDLNRIVQDGVWNYFDGGAFKIRAYLKGTMHIEVHPEIAWQLNKILAFLHPKAIPPQFRTKLKKKPKERKLIHDLLSFVTVNTLATLKLSEDGKTAWEVNKLNDTAKNALNYIGGVFENTCWQFEYDARPVLDEIRRVGAIPERKSHQYYPTPEHIARDAVEWADIGPEDYVLEPSAGQGHIAKFITQGMLSCIEISEMHCGILNTVLKNANVICQDFLMWDEIHIFNRIVMNPPFSDGRATDHVKHAATLLADNGVLVAILPASFKNKTIVDGMSHEWSDVYENEFQGCSVNVVILRISRRVTI